MQDPTPHRDFYLIKGHDLKGSVCAVPGGEREKLWRDFFSDPSQWWDHRPEKVTECQSCQSSHVNGRIGSCWCQSCCYPAVVYALAEILFRPFALVE
jgi:hypothetical protein